MAPLLRSHRRNKMNTQVPVSSFVMTSATSNDSNDAPTLPPIRPLKPLTTPTPGTPQQESALLRLPLDIRTCIYDALMPNGNIITVRYESKSVISKFVSLFRVNNQLNTELRAYLSTRPPTIYSPHGHTVTVLSRIPRSVLATVHTMIIAQYYHKHSFTLLPNLRTIVLSRTLVSHIASPDVSAQTATVEAEPGSSLSLESANNHHNDVPDPVSTSIPNAAANTSTIPRPDLLPLPDNNEVLASSHRWWKDLRIGHAWIRDMVKNKEKRNVRFRLETRHEFEVPVPVPVSEDGVVDEDMAGAGMGMGVGVTGMDVNGNGDETRGGEEAGDAIRNADADVDVDVEVDIDIDDEGEGEGEKGDSDDNDEDDDNDNQNTRAPDHAPNENDNYNDFDFDYDDYNYDTDFTDFTDHDNHNHNHNPNDSNDPNDAGHDPDANINDARTTSEPGLVPVPPILTQPQPEPQSQPHTPPQPQTQTQTHPHARTYAHPRDRPVYILGYKYTVDVDSIRVLEKVYLEGRWKGD